MRIDQVMSEDVVAVAPETTLKEVARLLARNAVSGVPVVSGGRVIGVVSEADILQKEREGEPNWEGAVRPRLDAEALRSKVAARTAADAMTSPATCVFAHRPVSEAAELMTNRDINRLPVLARDGSLVGIVTRADLVRAFARDDDDVGAEIRELLDAADDIDVDFDVAEGEVTLTGTVASRAVAEVLLAAIERIPGVVAVETGALDVPVTPRASS